MPDIHFECPKCGQTIDAPQEMAAQLVDCPACKETIEVPVRNRRVMPAGFTPPPTKPVSKPPTPKPSAVSQLAWILAVVFFTTSILFAYLYLSEKQTLQKTQAALARAALDMTKKSEAELKNNVQAAEAVAKENVSELAAEGRQALSGIYYSEQARHQGVYKDELDLRSDNSAVWLHDSSGQKLEDSKWTTDGDNITVGKTKFKIEGSDLIDSRGNRWLHIR
jgi:hypothetical protein